MLDRLRRHLPAPEDLQHNRWLRWLGPRLAHPRLWRMSRRAIALGVAIGVFFGLLVPVAQMPLSAAVAVLLRANLPLAVGSTLVSNPATFGPIYWAAWKLGDALIGDGSARDAPPPPLPQPQAAPDDQRSWVARTVHWVAGVGKPLLLGLAIFACGLGLLSYLLVSWFWIWRVRRRWRQRHGGLPPPRD
jgi:uncharacterized protein (DUF2062 family)